VSAQEKHFRFTDVEPGVETATSQFRRPAQGQSPVPGEQYRGAAGNSFREI